MSNVSAISPELRAPCARTAAGSPPAGEALGSGWKVGRKVKVGPGVSLGPGLGVGGFVSSIVTPFALGAALVPVYNLELLGGRIHTDLGFGLAWGAFPLVTAYVAQTGTVRVETLLAAAWATLLSLAQRRLSHTARRLRRDTASVEGQLVLETGTREPLTRAVLLEAPEAALRLLATATVALAAALVALRV